MDENEALVCPNIAVISTTIQIRTSKWNKRGGVRETGGSMKSTYADYAYALCTHHPLAFTDWVLTTFE